MGEDLGHLFSLHFVECYMSARFLSDPRAHGGSLTNKKCSLQIFWKTCGDFGEMQDKGEEGGSGQLIFLKVRRNL